MSENRKKSDSFMSGFLTEGGAASFSPETVSCSPGSSPASAGRKFFSLNFRCFMKFLSFGKTPAGKGLFLLSLFFGVCGGSVLRAREKPDSSAPPATPEARPLVWILEKNGRENPQEPDENSREAASPFSGSLVVIGSLYGGKDSFYPLPPYVQEKFDEADVLVLGRNPRRKLPASKTAFIYTLPRGEILRDRLEPADYPLIKNKIRGILSSQEIEQLSRSRISPIGVSFLISRLFLKKLEIREEKSLEGYFLNALRTDQDVRELEPPDNQFEAIIRVGDHPYMVRTLKSLDYVLPAFRAWEEGNLAVLHEITSEELGEISPSYREIMYGSRNRVMTEKLLEVLKSGPKKNYFAVIGIFHLLGRGGILDLLNRRGYPLKVYRKESP